MDTLLTGEIDGGQPATIKRPQKLRAPGGIGTGCAASLRNTLLLHGRVSITACWQLIVGPSFTAYILSKIVDVCAEAGWTVLRSIRQQFIRIGGDANGLVGIVKSPV